MFESVFGAEMPLVLRFVIAFIVVLGLIAVTAYVVRRFGGERLGTATARGRQPRLAVVDSAAVDGRRRLLLIRRDNVEHLLMIGGPTDVVVESAIVRAVAAPREAAPVRTAPQPEMPRGVQPPEGNMWPLQPHPEPAAPPPPIPSARLHRPSVQDEPTSWQTERESALAPVPPPRSPRASDPLAGLAAELARGPTPAEPSAPLPRLTRPPQPDREPVRERQRLEPRVEAKPESKSEPLPAVSAEQPFASAADQNIAEMAHRLEAALRRPPRSKEPRTTESASQSDAATTQVATEPRPKPPAGETKSSNGEHKPAPSKSLYDSLEQEMASLLGRPQNKS
jgi:flagellar protein FliO/FliZ